MSEFCSVCYHPSNGSITCDLCKAVQAERDRCTNLIMREAWIIERLIDMEDDPSKRHVLHQKHGMACFLANKINNYGKEPVVAKNATTQVSAKNAHTEKGPNEQ